MVDSTDAGMLTYHELDDALRLCELAADVLLNIRGGKSIHHLPMGLPRRGIGPAALWQLWPREYYRPGKRE